MPFRCGGVLRAKRTCALFNTFVRGILRHGGHLYTFLRGIPIAGGGDVCTFLRAIPIAWGPLVTFLHGIPIAGGQLVCVSMW